MQIKLVNFEATDTVKLSGLFYQQEYKTNKIVISTHGMATNCLKKRDEIIAKQLENLKIDFLSFNNRGRELMSYIVKSSGESQLGGTAFENIEECYFDLVGAIDYVMQQGYDEIYLLGHSLGATKTIFTYAKLQENQEIQLLTKIKAILVLSLIDIPVALRIYLQEKYPERLTYAKNREKDNMGDILMPEKSFIHPISVKTFLRYARDYQSFDFAQYSNPAYDWKTINQITIPLFMRWGDKKEMILQKPEELCNMLLHKIPNDKKDIQFIHGADHNYTGKEKELAIQIKDFIQTIMN